MAREAHISGYKGTGGLKAKAGREGPFVVGAMPMRLILCSVSIGRKITRAASMDRCRLV